MDYLQGGRGGCLIEFGPPLAEHLVDLLLEDGDVGGAALLEGGLEVGEHLLEVVHPVPGLILEKLVRDRLGTLPHGGRSSDQVRDRGRGIEGETLKLGIGSGIEELGLRAREENRGGEGRRKRDALIDHQH